jgi:hypothetical protein
MHLRVTSRFNFVDDFRNSESYYDVEERKANNITRQSNKFIAVILYRNLFCPMVLQTTKYTPWPLVRERTIPTERPPLVDEI